MANILYNTIKFAHPEGLVSFEEEVYLVEYTRMDKQIRAMVQGYQLTEKAVRKFFSSVRIKIEKIGTILYEG